MASYLLLTILSTVGSAGAAPIPSSGLVLVTTAYVTGDNVVAGIVAARTPLADVVDTDQHEAESDESPDDSSNESGAAEHLA